MQWRKRNFLMYIIYTLGISLGYAIPGDLLPNFQRKVTYFKVVFTIGVKWAWHLSEVKLHFSSRKVNYHQPIFLELKQYPTLRAESRISCHDFKSCQYVEKSFRDLSFKPALVHSHCSVQWWILKGARHCDHHPVLVKQRSFVWQQ